jgi:competence ComEA-like helix-hairpin-helix protein
VIVSICNINEMQLPFFLVSPFKNIVNFTNRFTHWKGIQWKRIPWKRILWKKPKYFWSFLLIISIVFTTVGIFWQIPALRSGLRAGYQSLETKIMGSFVTTKTVITDIKDTSKNDLLLRQLADRVTILEQENVLNRQSYQENLTKIDQLKQQLTATLASLDQADQAFLKEEEAWLAAVKKVDLSSTSLNSSPVPTAPPISTSPIPNNPGPTVTRININTATLAQLDSLPGIGPSYAQRILDYRTKNGDFKSVDELDNVSGIGPTTVDKIRDLITI